MLSNKTLKLVDLLKEGKTCNEICSELNISNKQLYHYITLIENKGLMYDRRYYDNGVIVYRGISKISILNQNDRTQGNTIFTDSKKNNFRALIISDLHIGNLQARIDLLDKAFDYCTSRGIHIIFCCGDIIDGAFSAGEQNIESISEQIDYFIKNYPFDKNILTFGVGGDHDLSALFKSFQDIRQFLHNYRHDIIIDGYNNTTVNIKNDTILLQHFIQGGYILKGNFPIILQGHYHNYSINETEEGIRVNVPTLSDMVDSFPTALEMNINFLYGYMSSVNFKQIYFDDHPHCLNEISCDLVKNRVLKPNKISNLYPTIIENLDSSEQIDSSKKLIKR